MTEKRSISERQAESFDKANAITLTGGLQEHTGNALKRALRAGDIVGGSYRLESLLGRGGMGYVFGVRHISLDRDYALKMLAPEQLNDSARMRFENEGRAIAKLEHNHIVKVYDMGLDQGICPYYVMDRLAGKSLEDLIKNRGPLPYKAALDLLKQIAEGLAYAHGKGIIHRDMKPSNVVILEDAATKPAAKIVDFGIAKFMPASNLSVQSQTATGQVFGSPLYMSPEQCMAENIDERSDVYSLGCTFYEMLTGKAPFRGENALATIIMHQNQPVPDVVKNAQHEVPKQVQFFIERCMSKRPEDRYQSMDQLLHDVQRLERGLSITNNFSDESIAAMLPTYKTPGKWTAVSNMPVILAGVTLLLLVVAGGLSSVLYNAYKQKATMYRTDPRVAAISTEAVTTNNPMIKKMETSKFDVAQVVLDKADLKLVADIRESWQTFGPVRSEIIQTKDGKRRRFHFPKYACGALSQPLVASQDAKDVVLVLPDRSLRLDTAGSSEKDLTLAVPEFIDHFPVNLIQEVNLRKPLGEMMNLASDRDNQLANDSMAHILHAISAWPQLNVLWLSNITLTDENCRSLDRCSHLKLLTLSDCGVDANIGKHKFLHRVVDLRLNKCAHVGSILEALKSSLSLQGLHLEYCNFDAATLAQMNDAPLLSNFELLLVENRPRVESKTTGDYEIARLPSEEEMQRAGKTNKNTFAHDAFAYLKVFEHHRIPMIFAVRGRHLTPGDIAIISSWPTTAMLALDETGYTKAEVATIKHLHNGGKVTFQHFY